jgi:tocopherol cyclase
VNLRVLKPEIFQGNLKLKNYFEGWYFKHVSYDMNNIWSFIPGVSLNPKDSHAFIQAINGITGESEYVSYDLSDFSWDKQKLHIKIGNSIFTESFANVNITTDKLRVTGYLSYDDKVTFPRTLFSPGIMGWYSFVPFMECKHDIISVNHFLSGKLNINGNEVDFSNGKGYIEKDWGTSFPECWLWVQANNFTNINSSFSFSAAKIPWLGKFFIGFIAFLYHEGKFYIFSTYNKSEITEMKQSSRDIEISLKNGDFRLMASVRKSTFGDLRAPVSGGMSRRIKESIDSEVILSLYDKQHNLIYNDSSKRAGLEVIEKIFEYL